MMGYQIKDNDVNTSKLRKFSYLYLSVSYKLRRMGILRTVIEKPQVSISLNPLSSTKYAPLLFDTEDPYVEVVITFEVISMLF